MRHAASLGALATCVVLSASLAACSSSGGNRSSGSKGGSGSRAIAVGFLGDLTGPLAVYGEVQANAFKARVDQVNADGGVGGRKIDLISEDGGGNSATHVANAIQLIQSHHVVALVGLVTSDECAAVAPMAKAHSVPLVCLGGSTALTHPASNEYVFNYSPLSSNYVSAMYTYGSSLVGDGAKKLAIIGEDVAEDRDFVNAAKKTAQSKGWAVTYSQIVPAGSADASGQAAKIAASKPSLVEYVVGSAFQLSLDTSLRHDGYSGPMLAPPLTFDYSDMTKLADPKNFVLSNTVLANPKTATGAGKLYVKAMASVGKTTVSDLNFQTAAIDYLGAYAVTAALQSCGAECSGSSLLPALEKVSLKLPGLIDSYAWSKTIHDPVTSAVVTHWDPATSSVISASLGD